MHIIGRLETGKDSLHFRNLDNKWLQAALKSRLIDVSSAQDSSGEYFLTANEKQLKEFLVSLSTTPKAFSDQQDLTRSPAEVPNAGHRLREAEAALGMQLTTLPTRYPAEGYSGLLPSAV